MLGDELQSKKSFEFGIQYVEIEISKLEKGMLMLMLMPSR